MRTVVVRARSSAMSSCVPALSGSSDGWRLGLAMLERRGMAAWARAWRTTVPAGPSPSGLVVEVPVDASQIVSVLATMALACAAAG